jgi:hypothetical protein
MTQQRDLVGMGRAELIAEIERLRAVVDACRCSGEAISEFSNNSEGCERHGETKEEVGSVVPRADQEDRARHQSRIRSGQGSEGMGVATAPRPAVSERDTAEATPVSMPLESHQRLVRERDESIALRIHLWACNRCSFCPEHIGQVKPLQDRPNEGQPAEVTSDDYRAAHRWLCQAGVFSPERHMSLGRMLAERSRESAQPGDPTVRHVVAWMRATYPQNRHAQEWAGEIERVFLRAGPSSSPARKDGET